MLGTPSAEIEIDALLVSQLLAEQHQDLQNLSIQFVNSGWDNAIFRLGDHLAVRLPRRAIAAGLIEKEQHWLPQLAQTISCLCPSASRNWSPEARIIPGTGASFPGSQGKLPTKFNSRWSILYSLLDF